MRLIRWIGLFLVLILGLSFAVLNAEPVRFNYYLDSWQAPLSLILAAAVALGAIFGALACLGHQLRLKREISKLRKAARLSGTSAANLRALSLEDTH